MDKNNSIRILRINLVLILAVWAKIHEKWLKIGSFDDSIRIFILKWGTFFILMRRYPLYLILHKHSKNTTNKFKSATKCTEKYFKKTD